jgi:hypothetical protein
MISLQLHAPNHHDYRARPRTHSRIAVRDAELRDVYKDREKLMRLAERSNVIRIWNVISRSRHCAGQVQPLRFCQRRTAHRHALSDAMGGENVCVPSCAETLPSRSLGSVPIAA